MSRQDQFSRLLQSVVSILEQNLIPGQHLVLGLSGGLDSCVLLDLLIAARRQFNFQLSALHVHHGLSPNADQWAIFCSDLCAIHHISFHVIKVDVPRNSGLGLEAAARKARYEVMVQQDAEVIVLAHHQDDQAETLMLQLLRGSGVDGLAAMPVQGNYKSKLVLRPLLNTPRSLLEAYANSRELYWVDDESNQDCRYDRNFLRHKVFSTIESRFPSYRTTLARTAENLADAANLLAQIAEEDATIAVSNRRLDIRWMKTQTSERSINLLRWWVLCETEMNLSKARLLNILDQLLNARESAEVKCCLGLVTIRRYRHWACIDRTGNIVPYRIEWHGENTLALMDGSHLHFKFVVGEGIALDKVKDGLVITNRAGAEHDWKMQLKLDGKQAKRNLKNLWQELGVPPWHRDCQPMLWHHGFLVSVANLGVDNSMLATLKEAGLVVEWLPPYCMT